MPGLQKRIKELEDEVKVYASYLLHAVVISIHNLSYSYTMQSLAIFLLYACNIEIPVLHACMQEFKTIRGKLEETSGTVCDTTEQQPNTETGKK